MKNVKRQTLHTGNTEFEHNKILQLNTQLLTLRKNVVKRLEITANTYITTYLAA